MIEINNMARLATSIFFRLALIQFFAINNCCLVRSALEYAFSSSTYSITKISNSTADLIIPFQVENYKNENLILTLYDDDDVNYAVEKFFFSNSLSGIKSTYIAIVNHTNALNHSISPVLLEFPVNIANQNKHTLFQWRIDDSKSDLDSAVTRFCHEHNLSGNSCIDVLAYAKSMNKFKLPVVNSFDVFDTIIGRYVTHNNDVFKLIEEQFPFFNFSELRQHAQMIALKEHQQTGITFDNIYDVFQILTSINNITKFQLQQYEIECEMNHTYLIQRNYLKVQDGDILISSSYFNSTILSRILKYVGFSKSINLHVFTEGTLNKGMKWSQLSRLYDIRTHTGRNTLYDMKITKLYNIELKHSRLPRPLLDKVYNNHVQHRCHAYTYTPSSSPPSTTINNNNNNNNSTGILKYDSSVQGNTAECVHTNSQQSKVTTFHSLILSLYKSDRSIYKWGKATFTLQSFTHQYSNNNGNNIDSHSDNNNNNNVFHTGDFLGYGNISTRHLCLQSGSYKFSLSANFNDFKIGAYICNQLVKPGQTFEFFINDDNMCIKESIYGDTVGLYYNETDIDTRYRYEYIYDDVYFRHDILLPSDTQSYSLDTHTLSDTKSTFNVNSELITKNTVTTTIITTAAVTTAETDTSATITTATTATPLKIRLYVPHVYTEKFGGSIVTHYLAKILSEMGHDVKMICPDIPAFGPNDEPIFDQYSNRMEVDVIAIYSENILGNPIGATRVIRWALAGIGAFDLVQDYNKLVASWSDTDLIYNFSLEGYFFLGIDSKYLNYNIFKRLTLPYVNPKFTPSPNLAGSEKYSIKHRPLITYVYYKVNYLHKNDLVEIWHPKWATQLVPAMHSEYIDIFRKSRLFICYDAQSLLPVMSAMCGCPSVIYPLPNMNASEYWKQTYFGVYLRDIKKEFSLYGISYGLEGISEARKTVHLARKEMENIAEFYKQTVYSFNDDLIQWVYNSSYVPSNTILNTYRYRSWRVPGLL